MSMAISVRDLSRSFHGVPALAGVDLDVAGGSVFALLGPNGAGKSTLLSILGTLIPADRGSATINGFDLATQADQVRRSIGVTGQAVAVDEVLTGRENLVMIGRLFGLDRAAARKRAAELLTQFDLTDAWDRRVRSYSGGMRRRLDLALSLTVRPPVLFLDEPTTGLDTRSRQALWEVVRSIREAGTTVLVTTQYLEEADQLADRIGVLDHGRIVAEGTARELKAGTGGEVVELRDEHDRLLAERAIPAQESTGGFGGLRAALAEFERQGLTGSVTVRRPSLDEVFLALTSTSPANPEPAGHTAVLTRKG